MQILEISKSEALRKVMRDIRVDPYGIKIMVPKAITHLLRINAISNISANILKQEMLSLGGDAAVARDALTGRTKKTDCLLIGNLAQLNRLKEKLKANVAVTIPGYLMSETTPAEITLEAEKNPGIDFLVIAGAANYWSN